MDITEITKQTNLKFDENLSHFGSELKAIRTGRANVQMLDGIMAEAYETKMPLNQLASLSVVDATLLQVTPFDPSNIENISTAIRSNPVMSLNPTDDGRVIRVPIPPLTEERRREIVKQLGAKLEEATIRSRNIRHEALNKLNQAKKDKSIGEDEAKRYEKLIEESMNESKKKLEQLTKDKETEILTI